MKWKDLSLKERKQIYDSVRVNNPGATYNEYIDRLNKLIPMEILMPLGGAGFVGHELNKE